MPSTFDPTARWTPPMPPQRIDFTFLPFTTLAPARVTATTHPAPLPGHAAAPDPAAPSLRRIAKNERRAAVRRALIGQGAAADCRDVLVLDPDAHSRSALCQLLETFGFDVHVADDVPQAIGLASRRHLAAAFVDVLLDDWTDSDGVALCRIVRECRRSPGGPACALVLIAAHPSPSDQVRAGLAGCSALVRKPPSRGDVARILEANAVPLPADARRG